MLQLQNAIRQILQSVNKSQDDYLANQQIKDSNNYLLVKYSNKMVIFSTFLFILIVYFLFFIITGFINYSCGKFSPLSGSRQFYTVRL